MILNKSINSELVRPPQLNTATFIKSTDSEIRGESSVLYDIWRAIFQRYDSSRALVVQELAQYIEKVLFSCRALIWA